jgi:PhnB protein
MTSENSNSPDPAENKPHPWPGLNWLTTAIVCADVRQAVDFYVAALQMKSIFELPDDKGELLFARMTYRGCNFTINREEFDVPGRPPSLTQQAPSFLFYLYVDDVLAVSQSLQASGAEQVFPARKEFWGDLRARWKDPFGYVWDIAQAVGQ